MERVPGEWSFGKHLLVLVLAVLLPVVTLAVYHVHSLAASHERLQIDRAQGIARALVEAVERDIWSSSRMLMALAESPEARFPDPSACHPEFGEVPELDVRRSGLWLRTPEGGVLCGRTPLLLDGSVMNPPDRAVFPDGDHPVLSVADSRDESGTPLLIVERPVFSRDGEIVSVVGIGVLLPARERVSRDIGLGPSGDVLTAYVDDASGYFADAGDRERGWMTRRLPLLDGSERLYAILRLDGTPVWAVAGIPSEAIAEHMRRWWGESLLGIALTLAISLAGAAWLGRGVIGPVRAIARTAAAVRGGCIESRVGEGADSGVAELALVGRQFDAMLDDLGQDRRRLEASEARYRLLFQEMMSAFALHEVIIGEDGHPADFRYLAVNPAFVALTGYTEDQIVGRTARELLPEREEAWFQRYLRVAETGEALHVQEYIAEQGRYFDVRAFRIEPGRFAVLFHDVTEVRRAELEMARLGERMALATSAGGIGVWEVDLTTQRLEWDQRMRHLHGYAPAVGSVALEVWAKTAHPDDLERVVADYRRALDGGEDFTSEYRVRLPDGAERMLHAHGHIRRDPLGKGVRIVGTTWDVTEQRAAVRHADEMRQAAEAANAAKDRFLRNMSHELRTPLNAIQGFGQLMEEMESDPRKMRYLSYIGRSAADLLGLIENILDLTDLDAGRLPAMYERFDLEREFEVLRSMFAPEAAAKGLAYRQSIPARLPHRLLGDPRSLRQILVNLIGNAIKFTPEGFVLLAVEKLDSAPGEVRLRFSVTDSGIGIATGNLDRVFDVFEQEETAMARRYGGLGLGLAISKRLVTRLGGSIAVDSEPGSGAHFHFTLIFANAGAANAKGGGRILIADDDADSRRLLGAILGSEEYDVLYAADGPEAFQRLAGGNADLLVASSELSSADGVEIARCVREGRIEGCPPALPIVMLTGPGEACRPWGGVVPALAKPIDARSLIEIVSSLLPRKAA